MADEKKKVEAEVTEKKAAKAKSNKPKKAKFSFKRIGAAIKRWFKDLKGEIRKIVWPSRQMVLKSTGVVLAAIIVIGAGIWLIDFAISGAVTAVNKAATSVTETTTEDVSESEAEDSTEDASESETVADETSGDTEADTSAAD